MAKRTNKTDHVLNLLAGSGEKKESKKSENTSIQPPVDPESTVSVIDPVNEEAELADVIRKSLETELVNEAEKPNPEPTDVQTQEPEPKSVQDKAEEPVPEIVEPETQEAEESEIELALAEAVEPEAEQPVAAQEEQVSEPAQENPDEFVFLNVMETLVEEKVIDYMKQFGVCICSHCKADVMALALTKLPAKYVVVNKAAVSPLINFYSNKYAGQITVEITKACIRVNETPHHNRE